jgi:hypothetical protein
MKKGMTFALAAGTAAFVAGAAAADVHFYNADSQDWLDALRAGGKEAKANMDFSTLQDFGIIGWPGPLTSAGTPDGLIPAGFISDNVSINASDTTRVAGLVGVGPSAGFGTPNVVLANYFVDTLNLFSTNKTAMSFHVWGLLGSHQVQVNVNGASQTFGNGTNVGIIVDQGETIGTVNLSDTGGGAEGIADWVVYEKIPAPGALALLGLAGVAARRRRRA